MVSVATESFVDQVKDALEHLYDPAHLRDSPLGEALLPERLTAGVGRAQALRQILLDGIEKLNFGGTLPSGARQNRAYQILVLRYVEALPFREVMAELTLSQTQFHREQRHALEALASNLEAAVMTRPAVPPDREAREPALRELDSAVAGGEESISLGEVIRGVVGMLADVAARSSLTLEDDTPPSPISLFGNRMVVRQLLVSLVGYILGVARGGTLALAAADEPGELLVRARYRGHVDHAALSEPEARECLAMVTRLARTLGGDLLTERSDDGLSVTVRLPSGRRTLLVIDDNAGAIHFISRLLADQPYTVLGAASVADGLTLARQCRPAAILLDIMMPRQDGWDALQALKHDPATGHVPVIVCTVLAESRLALALGAADFIRKPPMRSRLLELLERWTAPARPAGEARRESLEPIRGGG